MCARTHISSMFRNIIILQMSWSTHSLCFSGWICLRARPTLRTSDTRSDANDVYAKHALKKHTHAYTHMTDTRAQTHAHIRNMRTRMRSRTRTPARTCTRARMHAPKHTRTHTHTHTHTHAGTNVRHTHSTNNCSCHAVVYSMKLILCILT